MMALLTTLTFLGGFSLISFVAALLLCSPVLFDPLPRRERMCLPTLAEASAANEARKDRPEESGPGRHSAWLYLLYPLLLPVMLVMAVLVLIPAFAAMFLVAVCMNFRYCRRATYRALKQRQAILPSCRSYPLGLAIFVRKMLQPRIVTAQG